jgi:Ca2+-binding RTX toxin-like protein
MNRLLGAGGDDTLYGGNGEADVLNGGLGNDSVVADSELDALVSVEVRMGG